MPRLSTNHMQQSGKTETPGQCISMPNANNQRYVRTYRCDNN